MLCYEFWCDLIWYTLHKYDVMWCDGIGWDGMGWWDGMRWDGMAWHGMAWHGLIWFAMLCYAMLCYALLCHAMPCHATIRYDTIRYDTILYVMWCDVCDVCDVMWCDVMWCDMIENIQYFFGNYSQLNAMTIKYAALALCFINLAGLSPNSSQVWFKSKNKTTAFHQTQYVNAYLKHIKHHVIWYLQRKSILLFSIALSLYWISNLMTVIKTPINSHFCECPAIFYSLKFSSVVNTTQYYVGNTKPKDRVKNFHIVLEI